MTGATDMQARSTAVAHRSEPPKRCRSAYNIFYQAERLRILAAIPDKEQQENSDDHSTLSSSSKAAARRGKRHGKIGFQALAKTISLAWKALDANGRAKYVELARQDKERYFREKAEWHDYVAHLERLHSSELPETPHRPSPPSVQAQCNHGMLAHNNNASGPAGRPMAVAAPPPRVATPSPPTSYWMPPSRTPPPPFHPPQSWHETHPSHLGYDNQTLTGSTTQSEDNHLYEPFSTQELDSLAHVARLLGPDGCSFVIRNFA